MHIWLGLGGYLIKDMNEPMAGLLVLVVLKTALDAGTHTYLHESRKKQVATRREILTQSTIMMSRLLRGPFCLQRGLLKICSDLGADGLTRIA